MPSDKIDMESEVSDVLSEARERAGKHASPAADDQYLQIRLSEIEESLVALARMLDKAFAEIRGTPKDDDPDAR